MKNRKVWLVVSTILASNGVVAQGLANSTETNWSIESGLGYETNAYHAPDHSYIDYANPNGPTLVTPNEQGGIFIPLKVKAEILKPVEQNVNLQTKYRFSGKFFPDSALKDASSTSHKLSVGADVKLGNDGEEGDAYMGVLVRSYNKVYVDHDTGLPKTSNAGVDISNRYTFKSFGFEGDYEHKLSKRTNVGVKGSLESLDYEDPVAWRQYDHTYMSLGGYYNNRLNSNTKLKAGITTEIRDYTDRRAYDANGRLLTSNPKLTYSYMIYNLGMNHRFSDSTIAYFDYELLQRRDNNVGYNDMDQNSFKVRVLHQLNDKVRLRAKIKVFNHDYANAYNFEDPALGIKSSSGTDVDLRGEYKRNKHGSYYVNLTQASRDNTDDRYQYNNTSLIIGAAWEY